MHVSTLGRRTHTLRANHKWVTYHPGGGQRAPPNWMVSGPVNPFWGVSLFKVRANLGYQKSGLEVSEVFMHLAGEESHLSTIPAGYIDTPAIGRATIDEATRKCP